MSIIINNFEILNNGKELNINVQTDTDYIIESILLWDINTFKDYSLSYNLSNYLEQTNNIENITISASDLNIDSFNDIWFVEIESNYVDLNCSLSELPALGITYNLTPYYECLLNYLIDSNINIKECNNNSFENITITVNLLINSIEKALEVGFYQQAIEMMNQLKKICEIKKCNNCKTPICNSCSKFKQIQ